MFNVLGYLGLTQTLEHAELVHYDHATFTDLFRGIEEDMIC